MLLEKDPKRNLKIHFSLHVNHQMLHHLIMNINGWLSFKSQRNLDFSILYEATDQFQLYFCIVLIIHNKSN